MIFEIMEFALFLLVLCFLVPGIAISSTTMVRKFVHQGRRQEVRHKALTEKLVGW